MEVIVEQHERAGGASVADIVDRAVRAGATNLGLATARRHCRCIAS
jgi:hypothetical protein